MTAEIRSLTLWEMTVWTYRQQRAHRALRTPLQAFEWAHATVYGLTDPDLPRPTVHYDAAMVHAAVLELDERYRSAIIYPAADAQRPTIPTARPVPGPVEVDRSSREHWSVIDGQRTYYEVLPFRHVTETRQRLKRVGRKLVPNGVDYVRVPVDEYCPVRWSPDPAGHAAEVGAYGRWSAAMYSLSLSVGALELKRHRIDPEFIPPPPPDVGLIHDSWCAARRLSDPVEVTLSREISYGVDWTDAGPRIMERVASTHLAR